MTKIGAIATAMGFAAITMLSSHAFALQSSGMGGMDKGTMSGSQDSRSMNQAGKDIDNSNSNKGVQGDRSKDNRNTRTGADTYVLVDDSTSGSDSQPYGSGGQTGMGNRESGWQAVVSHGSYVLVDDSTSSSDSQSYGSGGQTGMGNRESGWLALGPHDRFLFDGHDAGQSPSTDKYATFGGSNDPDGSGSSSQGQSRQYAFGNAYEHDRGHDRFAAAGTNDDYNSRPGTDTYKPGSVDRDSSSTGQGFGTNHESTGQGSTTGQGSGFGSSGSSAGQSSSPMGQRLV